MNALAFVVPGVPVPAQRPRAVPLMRGGRPIVDRTGRPVISAYVPPETKAYEAMVADYAAAAARASGWVKPERGVRLGLVLRVYRTKRIGDLDNYAKGLMDGISKSNAVWDDDRYVVSIRMAMAVSKTNPRAEVEVHVMPTEDDHDES